MSGQKYVPLESLEAAIKQRDEALARVAEQSAEIDAWKATAADLVNRNRELSERLERYES